MKKVLFLVVLIVLLYPAKVTSQTADYLIIPKIGLVEVVRDVPLVAVEGSDLKRWDTSQLNHGVGYLAGFDTRIVIAGHNPGAFEHLIDLDVGDELWLDQQGVITVWVMRNNLAVGVYDLWSLRETKTPILTLITCWEGGQKRLLVNAALKN